MKTQRAATLLDWTTHINIKKNNDRALKSGVKLSLCHIHILQKLSQGSGYRVRYASDRLPKVWGWRKILDPPDEVWVVQPRRVRPSARRQNTAGKKQLDRQQPAGVCCFPAVPRTDTVDKTRKGQDEVNSSFRQWHLMFVRRPELSDWDCNHHYYITVSLRDLNYLSKRSVARVYWLKSGAYSLKSGCCFFVALKQGESKCSHVSDLKAAGR